MNRKFEQLIERYQEKRQIIELKQRHKTEELALEAKISLKEAFIDAEDTKEFGDFDQFFKELHQELIVKQEEFNKKNQSILDDEKKKLYDYFTKMLGEDDQELLGNTIVSTVMEKTMAELETTVFSGQEVRVTEKVEPVQTEELEVVSENEPMTAEEIEEITNEEPSLKDAIHEEKAPSDMVSTIDLEDLLKEIRTTIDE